MGIYVTPTGWRALIVTGAICVGSAAIMMSVGSEKRARYSVNEPPPVLLAPTVTVLAQPVQVPKPLEHPSSTYTQHIAAAAHVATPEQTGWDEQSSLQNAHFHFNGTDVIGDNAYGEAGVIKKIDADSGIWVGATLHANREGQLDHRIGIHAGTELGWGYATGRISGRGGYTIRITNFFGLRQQSVVELWDNAALLGRCFCPFSFSEPTHVLVGFSLSGLVVGRIAVPQRPPFDFTFGPNMFRSNAEYVALSGISTGDGAVVFSDVRFLPTLSSEKFRDPATLAVRKDQFQSSRP